MATTTPRVFYRGAATTNTATTLYTVPASTTAIISNILVANTSASSQTFTISFDGVAAYSASQIPANSTASLDVKQPLATTKTVSGGASATSVNFHITGVEVA